ncbi:hypothetical protein JO83_11495 [Avibacterium paragallinarum]|nr:hypothetical protein JO83_11495 [Avibacterium paragallinarum]
MIGVPFSLLPFFWECKRKEVAQRAKYIITRKEKRNLARKIFLLLPIKNAKESKFLDKQNSLFTKKCYFYISLL